MDQHTVDLGEDSAILRIRTAENSKAEHLDLSRLQLTHLPRQIDKLTGLKSLNLSHNNIRELPSVLYELEQLQILVLSNNDLAELPDEIRNLSELRELNLGTNNLETLPDGIGDLRNLNKLDVSENRLTSIPESVIHLQELQILNLSSNGLVDSISALGGISKLRRLNLSDNQLEALPSSIGQLAQLETLSVRGNKLVELPFSLGGLINLWSLDLSDNPLQALPVSLSRLESLQTLLIKRTNLSNLPTTIGKMQALKLISAADSKLISLPESIGGITSLELLDLSNNQLLTLPRSFGSLKFLRALALHGNGSLGLPPEILGEPVITTIQIGLIVHEIQVASQSPKQILDYYFKTLEGKRPLNEAKLILVGRGSVGKTSIVNRLVHGIFQDEKKTEGIKITRWNINLSDESVLLNIWDFGGQEIMHATHQFFLTQRSVYLLVLNGRDGLEDADAEYWLKLIETFGGESPVIIVMNKIREHAFDVNRRALSQKYPAIRDFIKTDCGDGFGFEVLESAIKRETDRLEHLRDAFPTSWFAIKDRLAELPSNFLSFENYRKECAAYGETDSKSQEALALYLHSLGVALNYKDDPRLQDTHVLNPRWVTNGIYKVLNSDKLAQQKGEIWLTDLAEILDEDMYPPNMRRFLFDLMKKFALCFSFPGDDSHFLVPELLDKQEPTEAAEFPSEECLSFQYHYSVLPEGILPRFIVRTHGLSDGLSRWRTGVIVRFENCRGLVKADVQDKIVTIQVAGPTDNRRRLLAVIRSEFDRIHRDFRSLQPQEMVPVPKHGDLIVPYQNLLTIERDGLTGFPMVVGNRIVNLDVKELLNGLELKGTLERRKRERRGTVQKRPQRVFFSYSHRDEIFRDQLETHLKLLQRQGDIETWFDRKIEGGDDWKREISDHLEHADIILLLLSPDFVASDYCYEIELNRALERHDSGEARVIPVIVRDFNWQKAPFARLQALPENGLAITKWPDNDSAWRSVSEGIERVINQRSAS